MQGSWKAGSLWPAKTLTQRFHVKHHPLAAMLVDAVDGRPPSADGGWRRVPPWRPGIGAVAAFTGHAVVALDESVSDVELSWLDLDGYGRAHDPRVLIALAKTDGWIDCLDQLFLTRVDGSHDTTLVPRPDLADHPRVAYAEERRDKVRIFGRADRDSRTVVTIGAGTAGLQEVSFELDVRERGRGLGVRLVEEALALAPAGEVVVVAAAPGNAASVRSILRAGLLPVGSVQLFQRPGQFDGRQRRELYPQVHAPVP
jgi:GNAT superfamily N-acetyltransferase